MSSGTTPADDQTTKFKDWVDLIIDGKLDSHHEFEEWRENPIWKELPPKSPEMKELTIKLGKFYARTRDAFSLVGATQEFGSNRTCNFIKNTYLKMSLRYLDE